MLAWLSQINPTAAVTLLTALVVYLDHRFLSPQAQAKVASTIASAMQLVDRALDLAVSLAPAGTTKAQLEAELVQLAESQLAAHGLDVSRLPPAVTALVKAAVQAALATFTPSPAPAPAPVPAPTPTPAPAAAPGFARTPLMFALAGLSILAMWFASCAATQKMTGAFGACIKADLGQVIDPNQDPALKGLTAADIVSFINEIVTENAPVLEAQLAAVAAIASLDAVDCALAAIEAYDNTPQPAGSGSAAPAKSTPPRTARARAWVNARRAGGR